MSDRDKALACLTELVKLDPKSITSKEHALSAVCISQSYARLALVYLSRGMLEEKKAVERE